MKLNDFMGKNRYRIGSKVYVMCADCNSCVQINKPVFGSLHLCLTGEERQDRKKVSIKWIG